MQEALREARKAEAEGEVPVGAIIVLENKVIARLKLASLERFSDLYAQDTPRLKKLDELTAKATNPDRPLIELFLLKCTKIDAIPY